MYNNNVSKRYGVGLQKYKYVVMVKSDNSDSPNNSNLKPVRHRPYGWLIQLNLVLALKYEFYDG